MLQLLQDPQNPSDNKHLAVFSRYSLASSACEDGRWKTALIFFRDAMDNAMDLDTTPDCGFCYFAAPPHEDAGASDHHRLTKKNVRTP